MACGSFPHLTFFSLPAGSTLEIWVTGHRDEYLLSANGEAGGAPVNIPSPGRVLFDPSHWSGPVPAAVNVFCTRSVGSPTQCTVNARVVHNGKVVGEKQCFVVSGQMGVPFPVPVVAATA